MAALLIIAALASGCKSWFIVPEGGGAEGPGAVIVATNAPLPTPSPTPSPSPSPSPETGEYSIEKERPEPTHFEDMVYKRPDAQGIVSAAEAFTAKIPSAKAAHELVDEYDAIEALYVDYNCMYSLAMIKASLDRGDAYWVEEERVLLEGYSAISKASGELMLALYESKLRVDIEAQWDPHFFLYIEHAKYTNKTTKPLFEREAALISEHKDSMARLSISYNGRELTYKDIYALDDYTSWRKASELWYAAHGDRLVERYIELVKVRNGIASALGFESYPAFALEQARRGFTPGMAKALIDDIAREIVPVMERIQAYGRYWPNVELDYAEYEVFFRAALESMSQNLVKVYDAMTALGLYDMGIAALKENGAFTAYIEKYELPFLFGSFSGDLFSMNTLSHEFGHFYNGYVTMEEPPSNLDEAEVHSQALELFVSNYFEERFGYGIGYQMRHDTLYDAVQVFTGQAYYTDMELEIYALDEGELTPAALCDIAVKACDRFCMNIYFDAYARYDWVTLPHILEQPLYTLSYVTSQSVALELYELSQADEAKAIGLYERLIRREYGVNFLDALKANGLKSPFDEGRMSEIAALARKYLLDEDWS